MDNRDYMREPSSGGFAGFTQGWRAVEVIIAINVVVFLIWQFFGHPSNPSEFLSDNLRVSNQTLKEGRIWTLLTHVFSHKAPWHLLMNMFVLWSFGRIVEREFGTRRFVIFYLVAGVAGGLAHCFIGLIGWPDVPALGASGAVSAVVVAFCVAHAREVVYFMILIPMPAYMLAVFFVGIDLIGLVMQFGGGAAWDNVGHGAHLGGAAAGFAYVQHLRGKIRLPLPGPKSQSSGSRRRRRRSRREHEIPVRASTSSGDNSDERRMDRLLEKVHEGGLDSLTPEEREWMIEQSKRYRG